MVAKQRQTSRPVRIKPSSSSRSKPKKPVVSAGKTKTTSQQAVAKSKKTAVRSTTAVKRQRTVNGPKRAASKLVKSMPSPQPQSLFHTAWFAWWYSLFALLVLLSTTVWWALQGAHIEAANADQLIDGYLFQTSATFHGAFFPGTHSFLLKWPLFFVLKVLQFSTGSFTAITIGLALCTVAGLAWLLQRIARQSLLVATLWLGLASMLLLVPAQAASGALLPVSMAMITTRNIEYLFYLSSIILFVTAPRLKSWRLWLAIGLLTLLFASDKLFLSMSVTAGVAAIVIYGIARRRQLAVLFIKWLLACLLAGGLAIGLLALLNHAQSTHIVDGGKTSPYSSVHGVNHLVVAVIFAILSLATNFGANPVFAVSILRAIPRQLGHALASISTFSFLVNGVGLVVGIVIACIMLWRSLKASKQAALPNVADRSTLLSLVLLWSSLAMLVIFVASNHYYGGDARYLTITVFALFVAAASFLRQQTLRPQVLAGIGLVCVLSMLTAIPFVRQTAASQQQAYSDITNRNTLISQVLSQHKVSVLVGDYWRVVPIQAASHLTVNILPLQSCTQPRTVLTSAAWQPNLKQTSFAYLLSLDRSLTDYPQCNFAGIEKAYGRPNSSVVIAGGVAHPTELLLFYDEGANHVYPSFKRAIGRVTPQPIAKLKPVTCTSQTIMNIVAHQDDDLLFMNPDLQHAIQAGQCVRTVYVTAGDAGGNKFYWLGREEGSEAAYDTMVGKGHAIWSQRTVKLADDAFVMIASPINDPAISLVFMHLPDGNVDGSGFADSQHESLAKLDGGTIADIQTIDGQSSYSRTELIQALARLITYYQPNEIRTQANYVSKFYPDHSDHMAVGRFVKQAVMAYQRQPNPLPLTVKYYKGYPIHELPPNVSGQDLAQKEATFLQYAKFDNGVCHSIDQCSSQTIYGVYLQRQYQNAY